MYQFVRRFPAAQAVPDKITDTITGFYENKHHHNIRNNIDMKTNAAGLQLLNLCKISDMMILNGRVIGNLTGHYTYYAPNGCSVVDYTMVDSDLFKNILYQTIELPSHLSDHCLQKFAIKCNYTMQNACCNKDKLLPLPSKFRWQNESQDNYPLALLNEKISNKIMEFQFKTFPHNLKGVNEAAEAFNRHYG